MHCEKGDNDPLPNPSPPPTNPSEASSTQNKNKQLLDSPSEQLILLRKQMLVEKLLKKKTKSTTSSSSKEVPGECSSAGVRKTVKMGPSSVLNRVKNFLPVLKTENEKLMLQASQNPASVSLEAKIDDKVEDLGQPMIELNLALLPQEEDEDSDSSADLEENPANLLNHGQDKSLEERNGHIFLRENDGSNPNQTQPGPISVNGSEKKANGKTLIEEIIQDGGMNQES